MKKVLLGLVFCGVTLVGCDSKEAKEYKEIVKKIELHEKYTKTLANSFESTTNLCSSQVDFLENNHFQDIDSKNAHLKETEKACENAHQYEKLVKKAILKQAELLVKEAALKQKIERYNN